MCLRGTGGDRAESCDRASRDPRLSPGWQPVAPSARAREVSSACQEHAQARTTTRRARARRGARREGVSCWPPSIAFGPVSAAVAELVRRPSRPTSLSGVTALSTVFIVDLLRRSHRRVRAHVLARRCRTSTSAGLPPRARRSRSACATGARFRIVLCRDHDGLAAVSRHRRALARGARLAIESLGYATRAAVRVARPETSAALKSVSRHRSRVARCSRHPSLADLSRASPPDRRPYTIAELRAFDLCTDQARDPGDYWGSDCCRIARTARCFGCSRQERLYVTRSRSSCARCAIDFVSASPASDPYLVSMKRFSLGRVADRDRRRVSERGNYDTHSPRCVGTRSALRRLPRRPRRADARRRAMDASRRRPDAVARDSADGRSAYTRVAPRAARRAREQCFRGLPR